MNKLLRLLFWTTASLFLLVGCGSDEHSSNTTDWQPTTIQTVNDLDGVTMAFKEGTITKTGGTLILENETNQDYTYGEQFSLEKKIDDSWYQVPTAIDDYGFNEIGYQITALDVEEFIVDWDWLYGDLKSGEYRIVKDFLSISSPGDYDTYMLAAEFSIK